MLAWMVHLRCADHASGGPDDQELMNLEVAQGKHESVTTSPETPTATSPETADDTVSDDSGI